MSDDIIRIDGVEYERESWCPASNAGPGWLKLMVRPKRKQTDMQELWDKLHDFDSIAKEAGKRYRAIMEIIDGKVVD